MKYNDIIKYLFEENGYEPVSGVSLQNYSMLHFKNDSHHMSCVCVNDASLEFFVFKKRIGSHILDIDYDQIHLCLSDPSSLDKIVKFIS